MGKFIKKAFGLVFFLVGIAILLYPLVQKVDYELHQTKAIVDFATIEKTEIRIIEEEEEEKKRDEYNQRLRDENQFLADLLGKTGDDGVSYYDSLQVGEMIGIINIPKINVYLPIYHGSTSDVLLKGIGHMENTSLPGQMGTHCLFTGHTGLSSNKMFDDIINLQEGDTFFVQYNGENLAYRVSEIKTVLPTDTSSLKLYEDKELVTLVTCYPKYINSHRLLVTGTRIDLDEIDIDDYEIFTPEQIMTLKKTKASFSVLLLFLVILIIIYFVFIRKSSKKNVSKKRYTVSENSKIRIKLED